MLKKSILFIIVSILYQTVDVHAQSKRNLTAYKMAQLFDWVDSYYVDDVDIHQLSDDMIRKTLLELDPHSVYITKDEVRAMNEPLEGSFEGVGISFNILNDTLLVVSAISGGPSEKIGIKGGDKIITIDGNVVAGIGIRTPDIYKKLRGRKGSVVNVGILRKGDKELLSFNIVRDKVPIYSIDAAYKVTDEIGYIRLSRFAASSRQEFDVALRKLRKEGMTDLIFDLTGNGGGYIDIAVQLADYFFDKGQLIVYTEGQNSKRRDYKAASNGSFNKGKLVVMIDESSASASEILAGAVQDWDRGMLVGRRSFGKGLVQRQMLFADSSMLRLTVSRYHTPTGRTIQKLYHTDDDEYSKGLYNRFQTGELTGKTSATLPDSLKYQTLREKRTVYGGGGIMPDIFVPMDTSYYSKYYRELWGKGIINRFVLNYVDSHRPQLQQQYTTFGQFDVSFQVTDAMLDDLQDFAQKEGLDKHPEQFAGAKQHLQVWFKGYIARDLWGMEELYRVVNQHDPIFLQAVETMKKL